MLEGYNFGQRLSQNYLYRIGRAHSQKNSLRYKTEQNEMISRICEYVTWLHLQRGWSLFNSLYLGHFKKFKVL